MPLLSEVEDGERQSYATGSLDAALSMRGQVDYGEPDGNPGSPVRRGQDGITMANCSTFVSWCLASDYNQHHPEDQGGLMEQTCGDPAQGDLLFYEAINNTKRGGVENLDGKQATWPDLFMGEVAPEDAWRGKGVAGAVDHGELGEEVARNEAKPGDLSQSWEITTADGTKYTGHSTIVHRVHAYGSASFGSDGPRLEAVDPDSAQIIELIDAGVCDVTGAVQKQPEEEVWIDHATFRIDEYTNPATVGRHEVESVELIGAHGRGREAETGTAHEDGGVFTLEAQGLDELHNDQQGLGAKRVYMARLYESAWFDWQPAQAPAASPRDVREGRDLEVDPVEAPEPSLELRDEVRPDEEEVYANRWQVRR